VRAKLAGTRQLYHVLTNQVPKPIPGVADMRPALETCGNCHWPGRDSGDVITVWVPSAADGRQISQNHMERLRRELTRLGRSDTLIRFVATGYSDDEDEEEKQE